MSPRIAALALAATLALAACGGAAATPATTSPAGATAAPITSAGPTATEAPGATTGATTGATGQVSANAASYDELVAALTAAGVPNASRWANEVMEYRPYPADDPTLHRLQDNLAKYNPSPETLAAILAALTP